MTWIRNVGTISLLLMCSYVFGIAQSVPQNAYRNNLLIKSGDSLLILEQFAAARDQYKEVLSLMQAEANDAGYLYVLNRMVRTVIQSEHYHEAKSLLQKADMFWESHQNLTLERGGTLTEWAVYHGRQEQDSLAEKYFNQSLLLLENCCPERHEELRDVYLDYAWFLIRSNPGKAEELGLKAIRQLDKSNQGFIKLKRAEAYILLGQLVRERGDTELHTNYNQAAELNLNSYDPSPYRLNKNLLYNLGTQYIDSHEWSKAQATFDKLIELIRKHDGNQAPELFFPLANFGSTLVGLKDPNALDYLKNAEKVFLKAPSESTSNLGYIHHMLAKHYENQHMLDSAEYYFKSATKKYSPFNDSSYLNTMYADMAEMYLSQNEPQVALQYSDLALKFAGYKKQEVFDPSVLESRNIDLYFVPMELRSRILLRLYSNSGDQSFLAQSLEVSNLIERIGEFTRNGSYSEKTKRIVSEHFHRSAQAALTTLYILNDLSPKIDYITSAFNFIEHNRYVQLFQDLDQSRAFSGLDPNETIFDSLNFFRAEIERLELKQIQEKERSKSTLDAADSLIQLQEVLARIREEIKNKFPGEYQIRYDSMLSLDQIKQSIPTGAQLFEYFWGDSSIFLFTLTRDTAILASIPQDEITSLINRILPCLMTSYTPDSLELSYQEYATLTYILYQNLIMNHLQNDVEKLIISPDGPLANLPLGALVTDPKSDQINFLSAPYLIRKMEIQYAYSSNLLFKIPEQTLIRRPSVLAMAYSSDDASSKYAATLYRELPYSSQEVDSVKKRLGGKVKVLKGRKATKNAFLQLAPDFDIIHLAIHGVGDTMNSLKSHLIFRDSLNPENGHLFAHELYDLPKSQWRLAVLSACETGTGKAYSGEGIFSISRGFAYAGTPSIIMSLWSVNDESTTRIMDRFYLHLNKGLPISKALQKAKVDFLDQQDAQTFKPFFWAGFVVTGEGSSFIEKSSPALPFQLTILAVALITYFTFFYYLSAKSVDCHR